jgi:thiol-disulfide isomerase/thioredoxin
METKRLLATLPLAALLLTALLYAQQTDHAMQLVKRVSETYRGLNSYEIRAVVTQEQRWEGARDLSEFSVVMAQDASGRFRIESKHPMSGGLEVSDGKTFWEYTAMGHQYAKKPVEPGKGGAEEGPFMPADYVKPYRQLAEKATGAHWLREETLSLEGKDVRCAVIEVDLEAGPAMKKMQESAHTLWIDEQNALILQETWDSKFEMMGVASARHTTVAYKSIHIGQPISDALFSFTPPANSKEVTDLAFPMARPKKVLTPQPSADFTLSTWEGKKTSLSDFKGKTVLLDFWATWCIPCRESTPVMEKLNAEFSSKGLATLAVDYGEDVDAVKGYLAHNPSPLPNLVDPDKKVADLYSVSSVPTFILISKDGKVTYRTSGFGDNTEADLRAALKSAGVN